MNRNTSIIIGLTLSLGLLLSCGSKPNPKLEEAYQKAAQSFVADESFYPILDEELFYFNSQRLDTIGVEYVNEQDAVKRLMKPQDRHRRQDEHPQQLHVRPQRHFQ